jgi:hypothetical protein
MAGWSYAIRVTPRFEAMFFGVKRCLLKGTQFNGKKLLEVLL